MDKLTEKDLALQDAVLALKRCIGVFKDLAERGRYPEVLLTTNGGAGWQFAVDAQKKCESLLKGSIG